MIDATLRKALSRAAAVDQDPASAYVTPHKIVAQTDNGHLMCFGDTSLPPLLVIYSLVNHPAILDLSPRRSVLGALARGGVCPYLLAWHPPQAARQHLQLADYILGDIADAVRWIDQHHQRPPRLLGVCQGGVLALCHAAIAPNTLAGLITLATPWNNNGEDNRLAQLAQQIDIPALAAATSNISGPGLATLFASLKPFALGPLRYNALADLSDADESELAEFMRMERWMYGGPDLAGAAFVEFTQQIYQNNALANGTLPLESFRVSLSDIDIPIFNAYATQDHLVPPSAAGNLKQAVSGAVTEMELPGGHLGLFIGRRAHKALYPAMLDWLEKTEA